MPRDFATEFAAFSLDMHHIYKMNGETWRFAYQSNSQVTFSVIDDPATKVTYELATLNRMNASGQISMTPYGLMPEHLRPQPVDDCEDVFLSGLPEAQRKRVSARHAMVMSFLALYEAGQVKKTDEVIVDAMLDIREGAEEYLADHLPDPEYSAKLKLWKDGKGKKPKTKSLVTLPDSVSPRALRHWVSLYNMAGKKALVDNCARQGNRNSYFTADEMKLLAEVVRDEYLTLQRKPISEVVLDVQHTFREENEHRKDTDEPPLRVPGREAVRLFIARLDKFRVMVARHGEQAAMKKMRSAKSGLEVLRPFERVEMDEWKIDLLTIMAKSGLLAMFSKEELEALGLDKGKMRWWLVVAIDCRTRCIVGMTLTANPKTSSAMKCLRMVMSDKGQFADRVGSLAPWSMAGKPEILAVDNGSAFKSDLFTSVCADLSITKLQTIAGEPSMRGRIERVFNTLILSLLPRLSGRTFGDVLERGDHPSEKRACLSVEDLSFALVRWVVDIYHNTPHEGLNGRTPLQQWEADLEAGNYPLHTLPTLRQKRIAFGLPLKRFVQKDGIRAINVRYHSNELARWYLKHGERPVDVRWFDENIGSIEVQLDGVWHMVPAVSETFQDVDASTWAAARRALRAKDAKRKGWEEEVIYQAIKDIKEMNAERQISYRITDHAWTETRFKAVENEAVANFDVVPTTEKTAQAADGYGRSITPSKPVKPSPVKEALEASKGDKPASRRWDFGE
ncbi:DDE-type integrase/transposase/recombinase [uncultured Roseobacter sp.]|uniref:DDE-type integrase/transposase/recombinase n=1 Tax=uncultured Roseobacter sp. TaxID=114847 RepID=UPI002629A22C|nr:DDE-type integrase/transposase/recombinase [uncultured Roseobacter sp.]